MRPIVVTPADHREVPWRNRRGRSFQVWPRGKIASTAGFQLNLTPITSGGPFSHYPGVDRVLTVVEGSGLSFEGHEGSMAAGDAVAFAGEAAMTAHLANGPVTVFNLLMQRDRWEGSVRAKRQLLEVAPQDAGLEIVHIASGIWRCTVEGGSNGTIRRTALIKLSPRATLIARAGEMFALQPTASASLALHITLRRRA